MRPYTGEMTSNLQVAPRCVRGGGTLLLRSSVYGAEFNISAIKNAKLIAELIAKLFPKPAY